MPVLQCQNCTNLFSLNQKIKFMVAQSTQELCVNAIRFLSIDGVEKAKSGHLTKAAFQKNAKRECVDGSH